MRPLTSLIIILGVVIPALLQAYMQMENIGPVGIEVPQSEEDLKFLLAQQALAIEGLKNKYLYTLIGLLFAITSSTIAFVALTFKSKPQEQNAEQGSQPDAFGAG